MEQIFIGIGLIAVTALALGFFSVLINTFAHYRKKAKLYKAAKNKQEEMLKSGEQHKWVELPAAGGGTMLVCEKTGWCPARKGFLTQAAIDGLKRIQENDKAYEQFYEAKLVQIAEEFQISVDKLRSIIVKSSIIKIEFHVELMEKSIKEYNKKVQ